MNKCYYRIVWENYPSDKTPLNEQNLNKVDVATDEMDNRIISLDSTKFDKSEAQLLVKYIEYDEDTGVFKITHYNGASYTIDTLLEKLAVNFDYDYQTQKLIITLSDGEVKYVDLSALLTQYEFLDSGTVAFTVDSTGKVTADIKEGSIEERHLRPDYLADIRVESAKAEASAAEAGKSEAAAAASQAESKKSEDAAKVAELAAAESAGESADSAAVSLGESVKAAASAAAAKESQDAAMISETNSGVSAEAAEASSIAAAGSAGDAAQSAEDASGFATEAESFTHGGTGTREGEDTDNAGYYYGQTKYLAERVSNALIYMGTVTSAQLLAITDAEPGDTYNISDEFITTDAFKEGAGRIVPMGSNVSRTADGYWDVLAGTPVTGVKGAAETVYRKGNVSLTPENIGALPIEGGELTGDLTVDGMVRTKKGFAAMFSMLGIEGTPGWIVAVQWVFNATPSGYKNFTFEIDLGGRGRYVADKIFIKYPNSNSNNVDIEAVLMYGGNYLDPPYRVKKVSDGTYHLIAKKNEAWGRVDVLDVKILNSLFPETPIITYPGIQLTEEPDSTWITPVYGGKIGTAEKVESPVYGNNWIEAFKGANVLINSVVKTPGYQVNFIRYPSTNGAFALYGFKDKLGILFCNQDVINGGNLQNNERVGWYFCEDGSLIPRKDKRQNIGSNNFRVGYIYGNGSLLGTEIEYTWSKWDLLSGMVMAKGFTSSGPAPKYGLGIKEMLSGHDSLFASIFEQINKRVPRQVCVQKWSVSDQVSRYYKFGEINLGTKDILDTSGTFMLQFNNLTSNGIRSFAVIRVYARFQNGSWTQKSYTTLYATSLFAETDFVMYQESDKVIGLAVPITKQYDGWIITILSSGSQKNPSFTSDIVYFDNTDNPVGDIPVSNMIDSIPSFPRNDMGLVIDRFNALPSTKLHKIVIVPETPDDAGIGKIYHRIAVDPSNNDLILGSPDLVNGFDVNQYKLYFYKYSTVNYAAIAAVQNGNVVMRLGTDANAATLFTFGYKGSTTPGIAIENAQFPNRWCKIQNTFLGDYMDLIAVAGVAILTTAGTYGDCRAAKFSTMSSIRYKESIRDISEEEADKLLNLRPVTYKYKHPGDINRYPGLIAEEVREEIPLVVTFDSEGRPDSLDYSKFVPYLIKKMQMQQEEINGLKEQNEKLTERLDRIEKILGGA